MYLPAGLQQTRGIFKQTMFENGDLPSHNAENPFHVLVSRWVRSGVCLRAAVWVLRVHVVSQEVERKLQLCDRVTQQGMAVSFPFAQNWSADQNGQIWLSFPGANGTQEPLRRTSRRRLTVTGNRKYLPPPESQSQTPEYDGVCSLERCLVRARCSVTLVIETLCSLGMRWFRVAENVSPAWPISEGKQTYGCDLYSRRGS